MTEDLGPQFSVESPALKFEVIGQWNKARASILTLPHHTVKTPVFMPVGTQGTIKGLTSEQVMEVSNTLQNLLEMIKILKCFLYLGSLVVKSF